MLTSGLGQHTPPGGALQESQLQQEGLHHRLESVGVFPERCSKGIEASRATAVAALQQREQATVRGVQSLGINAVHGQCLSHNARVNVVLITNTGEITHPPQQTVGNPRRAAAAACNLSSSINAEVELQQLGRALNDGGEIITAV